VIRPTVLSVEPSSTTSSSQSCNVWLRTLSMARWIVSARLYVGKITDMSGINFPFQGRLHYLLSTHLADSHGVLIFSIYISLSPVYPKTRVLRRKSFDRLDTSAYRASQIYRYMSE